MSTHPNHKIVDLGGPTGGRYWLVVSDLYNEDDAMSAAIHARVTGSVGATHNGVKVERCEQVGA